MNLNGHLGINQMDNGFLLYTKFAQDAELKYLVYEDTLPGLTKMFQKLFSWVSLLPEEEEKLLEALTERARKKRGLVLVTTKESNAVTSPPEVA